MACPDWNFVWSPPESRTKPYKSWYCRRSEDNPHSYDAVRNKTAGIGSRMMSGPLCCNGDDSSSNCHFRKH